MTATNFPVTIDSPTNPTANDNLGSPAHHTQHSFENDAVVALETKVGVDGSATTTSLDYKLSGVTGADKAVSKTGTETLTNKTLTSPLLQGLIDGWVGANETWTYSSATAITVPTGAASKYSVGDKLKFNQSIPLTYYWTFDTNSTPDLPVSSPYAMTDIGSPTYSAGKFGIGKALTLASASSQALKVGNDTSAGTPLLCPTGAFTIGAWIYVNTALTEQVIFQSWRDVAGPIINGILFKVGNNGKLYLYFGTGSSALYEVDASTVLSTGAWHYVVATYQSNYAKIYVDGILDGSHPVNAPTYNATNYVRIGCRHDGASDAQFFNGQIDDLFIINGFAVDQAWVSAQYALNSAQGVSNITPTQYLYATAIADTTLTVTGGSDYVPYNAAITSNYYSKLSSPVGFPQWFNWIAALKDGILNPLSPGSIIFGRFTQLGRTINGEISSAGDIGNPGGASIRFTLPVTPSPAVYYIIIGSGYANSSSTDFMCYVQRLSGETGASVTISTGAAWGASSNQFRVNFSYEI